MIFLVVVVPIAISHGFLQTRVPQEDIPLPNFRFGEEGFHVNLHEPTYACSCLLLVTPESSQMDFTAGSLDWVPRRCVKMGGPPS